ncbi:MAG: ABC transporter ATP-binding protein YtrE [bacterium ADurb.Bin212]|nr:MAG: ABC transporter ATP-binding protein YtrE [bacterium ADurb.Bin212]
MVTTDKESRDKKEMKTKTPESIKHEKIIDIVKLKKDFPVGENLVNGLRGVELKIHATDFLVIFGPSGCGKSTLLNIIAGIDTPTSGNVFVRDTDIFAMDEDERAKFRAKKMGIVHQMPYWIKSLNVIENVSLPLIIEGEKPKMAKMRARDILEEIGIPELANQLPSQLSGGQQQRVGIARALISNPWILMADEPTGNLDSTSADEIIALFDTLNRKHKRTIIMVTHNQSYWEMGTRRIEMKDGLIVKESYHG